MVTRRAKLEQILLSDPRDVFTNYALAMEFVKEGRMDQAVSQFDAVLRIDPHYTPAYFQKGNALLSAGRNEEASRTLQAGIVAARKAGDHHAAEEMQAVLASSHP